MLQRRNNQAPPLVMTWPKASLVLIIAGVFDIARYLSLFSWFFGPMMIGLYCTAKVGDVAIIGGLLTKGCVAGAALIGVGGVGTFVALGTIMAIAIGFSGWLVVTTLILTTNGRALKEHPYAALWLFAGLGVSTIGMVWGIYRVQIQKERAAFKNYQREQENLMQARAAQFAQAEIY